jgi:rare lipoprotein A
MGVLALSACTSKDSGEYSGEHVKQIPQKQDNATTKPVHKEVGDASWYGGKFHGQETANGETFNQNNMTAAHPSLPMGTIAKVTNLDNGKNINVRINDRGPFHGGRAIDLSSAAAKKIDMKKDGTTEVKIETKLTGKSSPHQSSKTKHSAKGRHHRRRK